jgi:hypothetical protein
MPSTWLKYGKVVYCLGGLAKMDGTLLCDGEIEVVCRGWSV